jgi:serine/threonine protein kinase
MQSHSTLETILRPGEIVGGKYRVERLIAEGGMAAVWAGVNTRTGKRVALKVVLRSFAASGEALDLFRSEALAASRIDHPNVVSIFDVIDHEGKPCIVMEMLDGETLDRYLAKKGPLATEEALALLLPAMRGVAAANSQGVIHRDLKPANIFLCIGPDGRMITSKVLDFGISVVMEKTIDRSLVAAAAGEKPSMFGTPAYMSPEHTEASAHIDARADVYGFGVLLFEALTGQVPFPGQPSSELFVRIICEPAPKVSQFRPDVSAELVAIVDRALAKRPADRFPNLDHFIGAVEQHLLPPSALPRVLTAMADVAPAQSVDVVATSQEQLAKKNSLANNNGETQILYGLPREAPDMTILVRRRRWTRRPAALAHKLQTKLASWFRACVRAYGSIGFLQHRAARVALLGVFTIATISSIVALARGRHFHVERPSSVDEKANRSHTPSIKPLDDLPTRAAESNPVAGNGETMQSSIVTTPLKGNEHVGPSKIVQKAEGPDSRLSGKRAAQRRSAAPVKRHAPRAGRLTAADF